MLSAKPKVEANNTYLVRCSNIVNTDTEETTESVRRGVHIKVKKPLFTRKKYQRNITGHKLRQIKLLLPLQSRHNAA